MTQPLKNRHKRVVARFLCLGFAINDAPPVTIRAADLAKLTQHTAVLNGHGKQVTYEGVLVEDLLVKAGIDFSRKHCRASSFRVM
jgi:hypothetical protein